MKKNKFRYVIIVLFAILLLVELFIYDYHSDFQWKNSLRLLTPVLMIMAMILSMRSVKKHGEIEYQ